MSESSVNLSLAGMLEGKSVTYKELYSAFSGECDRENEGIVLCGLSLGAVLALNYAIDHPDKVRALVLIAAQYKMPQKLLKVQNIFFHLMPYSPFPAAKAAIWSAPASSDHRSLLPVSASFSPDWSSDCFCPVTTGMPYDP